MNERRVIEPGGVIGVLGSGQLGRMFAIAARRLGYRVHTFSPATATPAGQVADVEIEGAFEDTASLRQFAEGVDVVTLEFENIPVTALETVAEHVPVRPGPEVLGVAQHRLREKERLSGLGLPVTPWRPIRDRADLDAAVAAIGTPAVLKTAGFGYDGKGQIRIEAADAASEAYQALGGGECVLEALVAFERELSVVAARGIDGQFAPWDVIENRHAQHILDLSLAPVVLPGGVRDEAVAIARAVMEGLEVVGVLCIEFFLTAEGHLLINEIAPRPHNSGHLTIDACITCQFEQQVRSVCALPLGSTAQMRAAAMANLLGELWSPEPPVWSAALADPAAKLHLYGKAAARPGRKMGHITVLADNSAEAAQRAHSLRNRLRQG